MLSSLSLIRAHLSHLVFWLSCIFILSASNVSLLDKYAEWCISTNRSTNQYWLFVMRDKSSNQLILGNRCALNILGSEPFFFSNAVFVRKNMIGLRVSCIPRNVLVLLGFSSSLFFLLPLSWIITMFFYGFIGSTVRILVSGMKVGIVIYLRSKLFLFKKKNW